MTKACLHIGLYALWLVLGCMRLDAHDLYVAPDGTPSGTGTRSEPYDLASALSGQISEAGDTFWLRGGEYRLGHVDTTIHGLRKKPVTFRVGAGEHARIDGSITIFDTIGYVVFRDFELYSSDTHRVSSQTGVGFNVTDIIILPGIACYAPNVSFINLVVHDQTRHGIYLSPLSTNTLVYGCILYNNGWVSPDNAEGHGLYIQGEGGNRRVAESIVFNNAGANVHAYENAVQTAQLRGVTLDGNVAFNAGAIQRVRAYRDWIAGVDSPATNADRIVLKNNMGYEVPGARAFTQAQIGRDSTNGSVTLTGNYLTPGLQMNNWRRAIVRGNFFGPTSAGYVVSLNQTNGPLRSHWNNNTYVLAPNGDEFQLNSQSYTFDEWRVTTRFDSQSKLIVGAPRGTKVFVRRNIYEKGRAHIVVYNWDNLDTVAVNVRSVLPLRTSFEVRNAQDWSAAPVWSGSFAGEQLELPMTNLTVARVNGPKDGALVTAPRTGPQFNVFVLLPRQGNSQAR